MFVVRSLRGREPPLGPRLSGTSLTLCSVRCILDSGNHYPVSCVGIDSCHTGDCGFELHTAQLLVPRLFEADDTGCSRGLLHRRRQACASHPPFRRTCPHSCRQMVVLPCNQTVLTIKSSTCGSACAAASTRGSPCAAASACGSACATASTCGRCLCSSFYMWQCLCSSSAKATCSPS